MLQNIFSSLIIFSFSFSGWAVILMSLALVRDIPRIGFLLVHYVLNVLVFSILFGIYFKFLHHVSPFATMAIAMVSLFVIEFVYWRFFYTGELWFLTFLDWILPAFLVASTIYFVGTLLK